MPSSTRGAAASPESARAVKRKAAEQEARRQLREATRRQFRLRCKQAGLPMPATEVEFASVAMGRDWRADYCWEAERLILEQEGGVWSGGRHTRGSGFVKDMEKYNAAAILGYRLIRVQPKDLLTDATLELIRAALLPPPPTTEHP